MSGKNKYPNHTTRIQGKAQSANTENGGVSAKSIELEHYTGAIPHPKIIEGFEKVLPGAADRILTMAEKEQEKRFELTEKNIDANNNLRASMAMSDRIYSLAGLIVSGIFLLACLGVFAYLVIKDKGWQGFGMMMVGLAPIISALKSKEKLENKEKEKKKENDKNENNNDN